MPAVLLGHAAYRREAGHGPPILLQNRFLESDPTNAIDGTALLPRPGLAAFAEAGDGPIRGLYRQAGVLDGDWLAVSGPDLWRVTAKGAARRIGRIGGEGGVEFASDGEATFIAAGSLHLYDGTSLSQVATPDDVPIVSLAQANGYFLLQAAGSGRFFWIEPGETTIDPLNFATAERLPDPGVAIRAAGDFIVLMNAGSTEIWAPTGDADAPFQRQAGLLFDKGCSDRRTAVNLDGGLFWVSESAGEGRAVYRGAPGAPVRISGHGIEEAMRGALGLSAFAFLLDGHAFYALRIEGRGTFLYDAATGAWCEFTSPDRANWRVSCAAGAPGGPLLLGDDETGRLWRLDPERGDDDGEPIRRVATGRIPWPAGRGVIDSLTLTASTGWTPGLADDPRISLRIARDGFSFGDPRDRSLGRRGAFGRRVRWERLGEVRAPGLVVELADSGPAQTRISGCRFNEAP